MKSFTIQLSVLAFSLLSITAQASSAFAEYDADKDGYISLSESKVNPKLMAQFADLDTDEDGRLSESEFAKFNG
ncbi:EF-hand domain-containing protein (plasmid) [Pseudoalteromonas sp. T1lg65]|uniref:EF-hand domain-containing protein n=1 Tax=Pseudoalteromonas sp. T1lg65 TaxID=2077101 RepID=UPI003F7AEF61